MKVGDAEVDRRRELEEVEVPAELLHLVRQPVDVEQLRPCRRRSRVRKRLKVKTASSRIRVHLRLNDSSHVISYATTTVHT